ncbi:unnamed protein product [Sphagnum troendelagicum]|uniref:C-terminal of Roc (COR) domain-containing protein n=1 Tax=Sphagnum troendelagicum TaxID=128251 RepID=A0ABP0TJC6_9BRYO
MDIKEGLVEIDPGDIDQLASSPVRFSSESSNDTRKQILQELPPPTMAMEIRSDETCDELNTRTMEEEGAEGVESGHLSGFLKPPSSTAETPIFPPQQPLVELMEPDEGYVSFDELIRTLQESQLETLQFRFKTFNEHDQDQENGNNSMWEAYRNHRLQVLDVVSRCNSLKELWVSSTLDGEEMDVLCKNLVSHPALEDLEVCIGSDQGAEMLCCMLQKNHNIQDLSVVQVEGDQGVEMLCQMLQNNHSIKTLTLGPMDAIEVASVGLMLEMNSTLENLTLASKYDADGDRLKVLLQPLTCDDGNQLLNKSIKKLHLFGTWMGREGAKVVAQMLLTNDSITHLTIAAGNSLKPSGVCTILESLEKNETLHTLDLRGCKGVEGDDVLAKVLDLLRINPWLKQIDLRDTQLERDGHVAQVNAQLASNARDYMAVVKGLPRTPAKFARVFLCGDAYAGKTTLRRSMVRSLAKGLQAKMITPLVEFIELNKPLGLCFNDPNEWAKRTRGIQIKVLLDHDDQKISIWDLAGQEEYHAFHDRMIPNLNIQGNVCLFLLVCNPFKKGSKEQKDLQKIKDELCYWLRFISSNTKRSLIFPPQVMVVMTHGDKDFTHKCLMEDHLNNLKNKFAIFINLSSTCYWINAHSSQEARNVTTKVTKTCGDILKKMVHIYEACMNVQHGLCEWNKHHPNQPIVTMETFEKEIIDKFEPNLQHLVVQQEFEKPYIPVAMFLHDAGEMIYFKDEDFVVVNPSWFCHEVMGHLIKLRGHVEKANLTATFQDGWGQIGEIEHLLNLSLKDIVHSRVGNTTNIPKYLVRLMVKMDLAYEKEPQVTNHGQRVIFVPTTLEFHENVAEGERRLEWKFKFPKAAEIIYIGRRLQCKDQELTTLTPGFFPQVQVILHKHFKNLPIKALCENDNNLIKIFLNGLEIFVELSGDQMASFLFIDVLVKSCKSTFQTLQLINDHVLSKIEQLCSSVQGCQGVSLVHGVLRPKAVENLLLCKHRKDQALLLEDLKQELWGANLDPKYEHPWPQVQEVLEGGRDYLGESMEGSAISLLGEKDINDIWQRRQNELKELEVCFNASLATKDEDHEDPQGSRSGVTMGGRNSIHKNVELLSTGSFRQLLLDRIDELPQSIHDKIVPELQSLVNILMDRTSSMEKNLRDMLAMNLDNIINLPLELQKRQVPCNVYFTTTGAKLQRKLIVKVLPGIERLNLHLLCECVEGIHVVDEQQGCQVTMMSSKAQQIVPYLVIGLSIFSLLLKVGAHIVAGIGDMVPNVGKGLALALDTQSLSDYLPNSGIGRNFQNDPLQGQKTNMIEKEVALKEERHGAEQWLVDFLKKQNISKSFGLSRVHYHRIKYGNQGPLIRWICDRHQEEGLKKGILEALPI